MAEGRIQLPDSYRPAAQAERTGSADPNEEVEVTITLRGPELPSADEVTGTAMDAAAYAAAYGAAESDAQTVSTELKRLGLDVYDLSLAGRSLHARGTVAQLEAVFGVTLDTYRNDDQGEFRGREGYISVPAALGGLVTGVFGLDDRRMARRKAEPATAEPATAEPETAEPATDTPAAPVAAPAPAPPLARTPADFERLYQFPAGDAAGQSVAIAEFGGAYFASDVQAFCQKYGRPMPTITPISAGYPLLTLEQIRQMPQQQQQQVLGDSVEVMMDVEIVAALCPAAQIAVYFAPFSQKGWIDLLNAAVGATPRPVAISVSWGLPEDAPDWSRSAVQEIGKRLQAAAMQGVTVCVAAGDDGAGDQMQDNKAHVNFPATSPFVLSIGGTMQKGTPGETVWWDAPGDRSVEGGGSTGGGVSTIFARPAWQTVTITSLNAGSIDGRVVPDVAALAGEPFYDLIFLNEDKPNGGTSAATPLWAALLARMGVQQSFVTPRLYARSPGGEFVGAAGCNDITEGDNHSPGVPQGYKAGPGFDAVSGWGTPVGTKLQQLLA